MLKASRKINPNDPIIEVAPYDPHWPEIFAIEAARD